MFFGHTIDKIISSSIERLTYPLWALRTHVEYRWIGRAFHSQCGANRRQDVGPGSLISETKFQRGRRSAGRGPDSSLAGLESSLAMYPALDRLLGVDTAEVETPELKETIQQKIVDCQLPPIALSNGVHVDLVNLEKEGRLTAIEISELKVTWVLGRWVQCLL